MAEIAAQEPLKLYYFDIPGKGEAIRLACHYAGIPLDDVRIDRETFVQLKAAGTLRFGQVPALEVTKDGAKFVITQSASIMRFIGKQAGGSLYPADDHVQAAYIDSIVDQEMDLFTGLGVTLYKERFGFAILEDPTLLATVRKSLNDEVLPRHLSSFESIMSQSSSGWMAGGDGPSIADFILVPRLLWLASPGKEGISADVLKPYPKLLSLIDKMLSLPAVVKYYETHQPLV
jgi:glutathione S-transferase